MANFAPIHIKTGYSFLQSGLTIDKIVSSMKKNDYYGAAIADLNCLFGLHEFAESLAKINKPYALGMEVSLGEDIITLYIKSEEGYRNLLKINSAIQKEIFDQKVLEENASGLIAVVESKYGTFKQLFDENNENPVSRWLLKLSEGFGDDFYIGIEVTSKEDVTYANKVRKYAKNHTYKTVAFPRIKYVKKDDAIVIDILNAIRDESIQLDIKSKTGQEYFMVESDYQKIYSTTEIDATREIINSCKFDINVKRGKLLKLSNKPGEDLTEICYKQLLKLKLQKPEYTERLDYELSVIDKMGYSNYFLLVQDFVEHAKKVGIVVGPGRGSSAGSLVSYLLNIVELDPIKYGLSFERFLNPNRKTMPDIDIDFMDIRRDEMVEYARRKYGQDKVANIVTFQRIMARQALRDIQRVYKYPTNHIDKICKSLPKETRDEKEITLREAYKRGEAFRKLVDSDKYFLEIVSLASKIEGLPRQPGLHPAGVVINDEPLEEVLPISIDIAGNEVAQYEFNYLEEEGFLKMDFLSLRNLTVIDLATKLVNLNHPEANLKADQIPFDDEKAIEIIRNRHTAGIFQLESAGMKNAIKTLKPTTFDDIIAIIALFRPGPMAQIPNYALRKEGKQKITYISPALEPILKSTYGIIIYQEQVSKIAEVLAGFSPADADIFRRAISKKVKEKILEAQGQFIKGSIKNGISEKEAQNVFNQILKFANYGFNKSHAVVYAVTACRLAYLKAYYPLEFYSAILQIGSSVMDSKFNEYVTELKQRNFTIYSPNINESQIVFSIKEGGLLFPLSSIHGVNSQMVKNILNEREKGPFKDLYDFVSRMYDYKISESQIKALIDSGALDCLYPSRKSMILSLKGAMQFAQLNHNDDGQSSLGILEGLKPSITVAKDDPIENLNAEYEAIGIMLSDNPLRYKKDLLKDKDVSPIIELDQTGNATIAGMVKTKKLISTKKSETMAYIKLFDETGEIEITVFPRVYQESYQYLEKNKFILVKGKIESDEEDKTMIADSIELLEE